ncbi:MAG: hypothetical protein A2174_00990 [Candidatus Portnoybacteria bacterium RBG_13_41_18]|uniref:Nudix hydrolase domain-containing protein n=1 Tax=Candidatus Portnoybacteria bacterium RBG_13_41_18 TaxID=1801991 RepID=A0A1G2F5E6_9BACT|nr:MAG: hypothetical protein A2174_00990 [Candidatus Portnoybacteria bacterium RBG_13_41_18]
MEKKPDKIFTVCLVVRDNREVLLARKKLRLGAGLLNGYGGKVREGKGTEAEAKRELKAESGLTALKMIEAGLLVFKFQKEGKIYPCYYYRVDEFRGRVKETAEMELGQWYNMKEGSIPTDQMWKGDKLWIPYFLGNKKFYGWILYNNRDEKKVVDYFITDRWRLDMHKAINILHSLKP